MTNTDFNRMKKAVEKNGYFRVYDDKGNYTEVVQSGSGEYGLFSVYPGDKTHCTERYFLEARHSMDQFKYLFVGG